MREENYYNLFVAASFSSIVCVCACGKLKNLFIKHAPHKLVSARSNRHIIKSLTRSSQSRGNRQTSNQLSIHTWSIFREIKSLIDYVSSKAWRKLAHCRDFQSRFTHPYVSAGRLLLASARLVVALNFVVWRFFFSLSSSSVFGWTFAPDDIIFHLWRMMNLFRNMLSR